LDYKELFKIAMSLISSPAKAWEEIRLEEDRRKVFVAFVFINNAVWLSSFVLYWPMDGEVRKVFR